MEFAITILIYQKKDSKGEFDAAKKSLGIKKNEISSRVSLIMKINPVNAESQLVVPTTNPAATNQATGRVLTRIRKCISIIPATHVIDAMAVWIYFVSFLIFNYIYWGKYWVY